MFFSKKFLPSLFLAFSLVSAVVPSTEVRADEFSWPSLQRLLKRCVVIPTGEVEPGFFQTANWASTCPQLLRVRGAMAWFKLNGVEYLAVLTDSLYSDGGDLNDVVIRTVHGAEVARRENVLAYGDILLALAGGDDQFPRISVSAELLNPALREDLEAAILGKIRGQ